MQKILNWVSDPAIGQGLYLLINDEHFVDLGFDAVEAYAKAFWNDPLQIDDSLKENLAFMPCSICKHVNQRVLCLALRPLLPLTKLVDQYLSSDETVVCYKNDQGNCSVTKTTLENALVFVIQMSLIDFCDVGQQYKHWFLGTHPLMTTLEIARRVYLNVFWIERGNPENVKKELNTFVNKLKVTIHCQANRIRLVAKRDPILNALANFGMVGLLLDRKIEESLQKEYEPFFVPSKMPRAGLEPARDNSGDFKSPASTIPPPRLA